MPAGSAFAIVGHFFNSITDVVVQTMNTIFSARIMKRLALTTALCTAFISAAHADDLNIKTMIPGVPQIDAESYILIDYNSGKVLAEQNADVRRDPASLTKMMTSYVIGQAMKAGKFKETDLVTIGNDAWATGNPVFKGSSLMFLKPGMQVPVSQLIRGINLQSGNDACVAMADFAAGSQDAFVGLMNSYVNALGLKNTHFQTAVMGGRTFKGREAESKKLLTWGFRFFETVNPLKVGKEFASEPVWFGDSDRASLGVDKDVYLTIPRGRMKDLKASYVLNSSELHAPLQKNQVVGTINFQLDGKTIEQRPLVVLQEIPEGNFFGKIIDYIKLMFHHWFG